MLTEFGIHYIDWRVVTSNSLSTLDRILLTGKFIISSSYDKTARAWTFDTEHLSAGREGEALAQTFSGHTKGVYPMVYIPR